MPEQKLDIGSLFGSQPEEFFRRSDLPPLGFEAAELAKAQLASHIRRIIRRRRLTQVTAAALMGIDQPKVSALLNGRLTNFSTDCLLWLLTALGQDVEILAKERASASVS